MDEQVLITTFTDPMMGLSWECEPVFRKLETHFRNKLEFRYLMAGLVRDVSDFMTLETLEFLFARHQIISSVELREALDIDDNKKIISLLKNFSLKFIKVKDEFFFSTQS